MKEMKNDTNMFYEQINLNHPFPSTRYQGSKLKIVDWIWENISHIPFTTALDAFGGTGCVSHMLKNKGKQVTYNDVLKFNYIIGKALIENDNTILTNEDIESILTIHSDIKYPTFIQENFKDVFYLEEENAWLDIVVTNIHRISDEYKRALAWFALFQSCIIKRPYNLFHRANLYVRTSEVERNFGNKTTWDKPFEEHFINFAKEANLAVFNNGIKCKSGNQDIFDIVDINYDLVYIDTPYISNKGIGTDYLDFYHFLEGLLDYNNWNQRILRKYKHMPLYGRGSNPWSDKRQIFNSFERLIEKFRNSTLVISYRSDGIPNEEELLGIIKKYKNNVYEIQSKDYKYALSHGRSAEILFIAK